MPMFTTSVMLFPLKPFHSPLRTLCEQEEGGSLPFVPPSAVRENAAAADGTYVAEGLHLVQHAVHLGHHVCTVHTDGRVGAVPQSDVEHGTTLRDPHRHTHTRRQSELQVKAKYHQKLVECRRILTQM